MIRAFLGNQELHIEFMTFAGGERHVKIKNYLLPQEFNSLVGKEGTIDSTKELTVIAHIDSSDVLMDLILFTDAFVRHGKGTGESCYRKLFLPYIPYARQDRVMVSGEPLSAAVFGKLINMLEYDRVIVDDPHSDVAPSHIENVGIYDQATLAVEILGKGFFEDSVIVAPDAGAIKKVSKLATLVGKSEIGVGNKHRDLTTGQITSTSYSGPDVSGKRVVMIDDICDGGRTFIELAKVLRANGASEIILYVTHGIFSQGADVFDGYIDEVYSTYPWVKNIDGRNEKNIFKNVDRMIKFQ